MIIEKMKRYMSKTEYCQKANLCPHSVRQMIKSGQLKTELVGTREKIVVETWQAEIKDEASIIRQIESQRA